MRAVILLLFLACAARGAEAPITFTGGHQIGKNDYGRPVVLIAAALEVKPEVFREAFSGVTPAKGGKPSDAEARKNKAALMKVLSPHGVTNDRLDEVSNYYRFRKDKGQMWPTTPAKAHAVIEDGKVLKIVVSEPGSGYCTPPKATIEGMEKVELKVTLQYDKDMKKNGAVKSIEPVKPLTKRMLRLPETPYPYANIDLPAHFRTQAARRFDNTPSGNPVTDNGATLGRVLFYDTRLSANNTVACASCHHQSRAFVDVNRFSKGFEGKQTDRNAMSLVNLRYYQRGRFFWDERARSLEDQVLMPIQSKTEMGQDLTKLVALLAKDVKYSDLFTKAFGDSEITSGRISRAVAQFLRSMVSYQSKYDEGLAKARGRRDDFDNFTAQENRGKSIFLANCATCHLPQGQDAHFVMDRTFNNGLDADFRKSDGGVGDITLIPADLGRFKSPSLRNVEYTGPYMHDGRLDTLEKVIDHYSRDIKNHPNVDGRVRRRLNLSNAEKAALVAFLKTLSDPKFIADPKFSDPFQ